MKFIFEPFKQNNMIIADIFGGMGNQMFQYATAYKLALMMNTELVLNTSALKKDIKRSYALKPFWINNQIIEFDIHDASTLKKYIYGVPNRISRYKEPAEFVYDTGLSLLKGDYHISGYWQNPAYFNDIREVISSIFSLRSPSSEFIKMQKAVREMPSLSLHVRRGDFVENSYISKIHDVCDIHYYVDAINTFRQMFGSDHYNLFVFSDDPGWCQQQFAQYSNVHIVRSLTDAEEMLLMSECHHNITANSTFSWWGAWLNKNPDKIVITPEVWLKNTNLQYQLILPEGWVKIKH
ncbi:MAG: alpha-1,2-fucosyltransferase [Chitinophagaceae bacterium]